VSLAGVVDLAAAIAERLGDGAARRYVGQADVEALSPRALLPLGVPTLLAHGEADDRVPISQSTSYLPAARAAGDDVELLTGPHGHFAYLDPDEPAWIEVAERLVAALR
jgi:pimeloyl-ACP methyl ester carboxylesterase